MAGIPSAENTARSLYYKVGDGRLHEAGKITLLLAWQGKLSMVISWTVRSFSERLEGKSSESIISRTFKEPLLL